MNMKKYFLAVLLVGLTASVMTTQVRAAEKLEQGKDRIDTPAIGSGLCVHNLFQSNMVIQRDKPIRVWGWAKPGEKVTVTFGGKTQSSTAAADRSWKVELPAMPASSEPRTMVVQGKDKKIELENILVGDVWLLGGQSNMEFEIHKTEGGPLEIVSANFKNIRLFHRPAAKRSGHQEILPPSIPVDRFFQPTLPAGLLGCLHARDRAARCRGSVMSSRDGFTWRRRFRSGSLTCRVADPVS